MTQQKALKLLSNLLKTTKFSLVICLWHAVCIFTLCTLRHLKSISPLYYSLLRLIGSLPQWSWIACVWFSSPCLPSLPPWQPSPWRPTCSSGEHEQKTKEWFEFNRSIILFCKIRSKCIHESFSAPENKHFFVFCILQIHKSLYPIGELGSEPESF